MNALKAPTLAKVLGLEGWAMKREQEVQGKGEARTYKYWYASWLEGD